MDLRFLGTGAADWTQQDWDERPDTSRFLTCALVDDHILIDCGPTLFRAARAAGADLSRVDTVLLTHLHDDHYDPATLAALAANHPLTLYTEAESSAHIPVMQGLSVCPLQPELEVPLADGAVTAVLANHRVGAPAPNRPVHYLLRQGDATLFWGCDGHRLLCTTWAFLRRCRFDVMVLDGTFGDAPALPTYFEHNNIAHLTEMAQIFRGEGMLKPGGRVVMCHLSKEYHQDHDTLSARMAAEQILVVRDGMCLTIPERGTAK